jgi:hypothetical protein
MGEAPALIDPQLAPGPTLNTQNGWRTWPGGTYLRLRLLRLAGRRSYIQLRGRLQGSEESGVIAREATGQV